MSGNWWSDRMRIQYSIHDSLHVIYYGNKCYYPTLYYYVCTVLKILLFYQRVIDFEETECMKRDPEVDMLLFQKTCNEIRTLMKEICELKKKNTEQVRKKSLLCYEKLLSCFNF